MPEDTVIERTCPKCGGRLEVKEVQEQTIPPTFIPASGAPSNGPVYYVQGTDGVWRSVAVNVASASAVGFVTHAEKRFPGLGDTVIFTTTEREGRQERAAIVTMVKADDGRRDLLVAGRAGFYPEWDVPYSAGNDPRTWHEKGD